MEALRRCATPAAGEGLLGALARLVEQPPPNAPLPALPPLQRGEVLEIVSDSFVKCFLAHATHTNSRAAAASRQAYSTGTYAVVCGGDAALGDDPEGLQRVICAALGQRDAEELAGYGPHSPYRTYALPAFARRVEEAQRVVEAGARLDGYRLPPGALQRRTHALVHANELRRKFGQECQEPLTETEWRRAANADHNVASGVAPPDERPFSDDFRGLYRQLDKAHVSKAASHYPYPVRDLPEGHVRVFDCAGILAELERLDGEVAPDDPDIWGILDALYLHVPRFEPALGPALAKAAAEDGTAAVMPPAGRAHKDTPFDKPFEDKVLPKWLGRGVLRRVAKEEALAPGHVVSAIKVAVKGDFRLPQHVKDMVDRADFAALGREAEAWATRMVEETQARIDDGEDPAAAAEAVYGALLEEPSIRMCHSARGLNEHVKAGSFRFPGPSHILRGTTEDSELHTIDMSSFYFAIMYGREAGHAMYLQYKDSYFQQLRMSMGVQDSACVASIGTALLVHFARRCGIANVWAYIDDILCTSPRHRAVEDQAIIMACANIIVPGGVSMEKTRPPKPAQEGLGLVYDFPANRVYAHPRKIFAYAVHTMFVHKCLSATLARRDMPSAERHPLWDAVTTPSMDKVVGKLSYLCETMPLGRLHMRGLYALSVKGVAPSGFLRGALVTDLAWWVARFRAGEVSGVMVMRGQAPPLILRANGGGAREEEEGARREGRGAVLRSDAGEPGGGVVHNGVALHRTWSATEKGFHSDLREILTLQMGVEHFDSGWPPGTRVLFLLDHSGDTHCLNKGNAQSRRVREVIDNLYERAAARGYHFVAAWAPRESNVWCDRLSKCADRWEAEVLCRELGLTLA